MSAARTIAVALALVLLLGGCAPAPELRGAAAPGDAEPGGTLSIAVPRPLSLDPADAADDATTLLVATMCDTILGYDPDTGDLVNVLAKRVTVADGGQRVTIELRDDAVFQDGTPVEARDVAWSWSRAASPDIAGAAADLLSEIVGWDELRGIAPTEPGSRARRELVGLRILNEHTVQVSLTRPDASWPAVLAHPVTAPMSQDAASAAPDEVPLQPPCAGPYRPAAPVSLDGDRLRLVRAENHVPLHAAEPLGGAGFVDVIDVTLLRDDPRALAPAPVPGEPAVALPVPEVDLVALAVDQLPEARGRRGVTVVDTPGSGVEYLGLPQGTPPEVAHRLAAAIDRDGLARLYAGARDPATGFVPPSVPGAPACPVDAGAGLGRPDLSGATVELLVNDAGRNVALSQALARQLETRLGVSVAVQILDWSDLLGEAIGAEGLRNRAYRLSWSSPIGSTAGYLRPLAHSDGIGTANFSQYVSGSFEEDLDDAAEEEDAATRALYLERANATLCADLPMIPLLFERRLWLLADRLAVARGSLATYGTGLPRLRAVYVR